MDEERIIQALLNIDAKVEQLATKERVDKFEGRVLDILDNQTVILQRLDQEHVFTIERLKRMEHDIEQLKQRVQLV